MQELANATILVVDDDPALRRLLRIIFEAHDFRVIEAENGAEGLARVEEQEPDAIVLDLQMPVMDGRSFCTNLHTDHVVPIIIVSGSGARGAAEELGVGNWMDKPFDPERLAEVVESLVAPGHR